MTSEVMLLNVQGAALAADSALTAIEYHADGTASVRYQTGADKIFLLDQSMPVAAMIFDVAEFYRYPWAAIFEAFTASVPSRGNSVQKVAQSLVQYLARWTSGADSRSQSLLPLEEGQERLNFAIYVAALVQRFHQCVELSSERTGQRPQAQTFLRALDMLRFESQYSGEYFQNLFLPHGQPPSRRPLIGESSSRLVSLLDQYLDRLLTGMSDSMFGEGVISKATKSALAEITIGSCLTDWLPPGVPKTGIVFAGFASTDVRPSFIDIRIGSAFAGLVKHQLVTMGSPTQREPAIIQSFAQADLIDALLRGAQPGYKYVLFQLMRQGISSLLNAVSGEVAKKDVSLAKTVLQQFDQAPLAVSRAIIMAGDDIARNAMEMRVADVVNSASPELLADYARKLVRLSVIEHELTGSQSVAEPILALRIKKGRADWIRHNMS
ncbi:MAG: hypothetical protein SGJ03_04890 [Alphaproteobacteria bacterium]|nr:hypothetical protein [Alphaproteobacteria bacterium]